MPIDIELTEQESEELKRLKSYFPFRDCAAVKSQDGKVEYFAAGTMAKANNYARKIARIMPCAIFKAVK